METATAKGMFRAANYERIRSKVQLKSRLPKGPDRNSALGATAASLGNYLKAAQFAYRGVAKGLVLWIPAPDRVEDKLSRE